MATSKKKIPAESLALAHHRPRSTSEHSVGTPARPDDMVKPSTATKSRVCFDFSVEIVDGRSKGALRFRGPAVQGRPGERFVYLRIGSYAGQKGTDVARRAKIGLEGITPKLLDAVRAKRGGVLEVQFAGTDSKGGAACATVPLLGNGWYVA